MTSRPRPPRHDLSRHGPTGLRPAPSQRSLSVRRLRSPETGGGLPEKSRAPVGATNTAEALNFHPGITGGRL